MTAPDPWPSDPFGDDPLNTEPGAGDVGAPAGDADPYRAPYGADEPGVGASAPAPGLPADGPPGTYPYLDTLNPEQRAAVTALDGPVLVLAGAGTGKTRVLTTRLGHLLMTRRAWPSQILAVTFTNKAAREMKERVAAMIGGDVEGWWMGTFHALAARILRRHAEAVGLKSNFTILDTDDQIRLLKQVMEAGSVDGKRWPAKQLLGVIERWKDRALTPDRLTPEDGGDLAGGRMIQLYRDYQERLRSLNACDFGDLLLHTLTLFGHTAVDPGTGRTIHPILEEYQRRFRYLLVDEYQDTNVAQYLWLRALAQGHHNICCVGDDDQSIYGWRGAEVGNILRFEQDFPGATVIRLERNYRSTGRILGAASGLIANNQGRLGKTLFSEGASGDPVQVRIVWDAEEEARWIGDEIESLQTRQVPLSDVAILVRASFQMREFEERLITLGLPYRVIGGPRFYERMEIRDAMAYLRVIAQSDDDLAFERIINVPKRGIGKTTVQTLHAAARRQQVSLYEAAARLVETDELTARARTPIKALIRDFDRWRDQAERIGHADLARLVLDESGYTGFWQADKSPEAPGRLENLKELVTAMEEFDSLLGFLEHVSLVMDTTVDSGGEMVSLMTLHGAKGLEFAHVFLPGWEEGLFPHQRAMDEQGVAGLEEERRLAYVGLTRAKTRAVVMAALNRRVHGQWQSSLPSRFIGELPDDFVVREQTTGMQAPDPHGVSDTAVARLREAARTHAAGGSGYRPTVIDGVDYSVEKRPQSSVSYRKGDRVFHRKFGYGTVVAADGEKLGIDFDHSGEKRVMDSFVVPASKAD
ncbi:UvrD-helicase domain-containing protein [Fodinicurvata sp. EGI_FJ10296]|uniref:UvrD-helicase domain-containing protein n=1 Tax=Fodinicurvata sp. EGI_FJ10296 TaxID=3231908 RepID=UPI0034560340